MRPITVSVTGAGTSDWKLVNWHISPINIGIGVDTTGIVSYSVEYTYVDVNNLPPGVPDAPVYPLTTLSTQTGPADGNISWPVAYIRLNVTDGTGTARMTYIQAGIEGA